MAKLSESLYRVVVEHYPHRIADAAHRFQTARPEDQPQRCVTLGNSVLQCMAVFLLANHCTLKLPAEDEAAVQELLLQHTDGEGKWKNLLDALVKVLAALPDGTGHFFPKLVPWWKKKGQPAASAFVERRNAFAHHRKATLEEVLDRTETLLQASGWLMKVSVVSNMRARERRTDGRHGEFLAHRGKAPRLWEGSWTADPYSDRVYLLRPDGGLLDLSGFVEAPGTVLGPEETKRAAGSTEPALQSLLYWCGTAETKQDAAVAFLGNVWHTGGRKRVLLGRPAWRGKPGRGNGATGRLEALCDWAHRADRHDALLPNRLVAPLVAEMSAASLKEDPGVPQGWAVVSAKPLGGGQHNEVVEVENGGRRRALKRVRPALSGAERTKAVERLEREARLFETLGKWKDDDGDSPHLVAATRATTNGGDPALLMPVVGTTLANRLKGPLDYADALNLAWQAAKGLRRLHRFGVLHRDLKPQNFLLEPGSLLLMLADLSSALHMREHSDLTEVNEELGTPGWLAPETQQWGQSIAASDVYSLGLVLRSIDAAVEPGSRPAGETQTLGRLVGAMLKPQPNARPAIARVVVALGRCRNRLQRPDLRVGVGEGVWAQARALRQAVEQEAVPSTTDLCNAHPNLKPSEAPAVRRDLCTLARWHRQATWFHALEHRSVQQLDATRAARISLDKVNDWLQARTLAPVGTRPVPARQLGLGVLLSCQPARPAPLLDAALLWQALRPAEGAARQEPDQLAAALANAFSPPFYDLRHIPKPNGGKRLLHQPTSALRDFEARLARHLGHRLLTLPDARAAMAFVPGRSTGLAARLHAGAKKAVVVDIHNFFGSVTPSQVPWSRVLHPDVDPAAREALESVLFVHQPVPGHDDRTWSCLPQGAPTSPALANLAALPLDSTVLSTARQRGWTYTRYADDLVLSSDAPGDRFFDEAFALLKESVEAKGWRLSPQKTRLQTAGRGAGVVMCGLRVPETPTGPIRLSRLSRRAVRKARFQAEEVWDDLPPSVQWQAAGHLAYAYQATGAHAYAAAVPSLVQTTHAAEQAAVAKPPRVRATVQRLAERLCSPTDVGVFVRAWATPD